MVMHDDPTTTTSVESIVDVPALAIEPVVAVTVPHAEFEAFFAATRRDMERLAYLLNGSATSAEEAVQDAYVRVYRRWLHIDDPGPYLRRAVVNACTSAHRRRAVARRWQAAVATADSYLDQPDELFDALRRLPARRRAVIVLRFYERLELHEIADALDVSTGTVKSTLHRALAQLKGQLS
jgi:RNA polymerase sigma-70 factor (sigma-E family)